MPVISCQVVSESVTIFSTLDVLSPRSYRSRDDVPERRASQGDLSSWGLEAATENKIMPTETLLANISYVENPD